MFLWTNKNSFYVINNDTNFLCLFQTFQALDFPFFSEENIKLDEEDPQFYNFNSLLEGLWSISLVM